MDRPPQVDDQFAEAARRRPSLLVDIIAAPQAGGPAKGADLAGAIVSVLIPRRWVLYVAPDHPAYPELLAEELKGWPVEGLRVLDRPGLPHVTREYAKAELARRGRR